LLAARQGPESHVTCAAGETLRYALLQEQVRGPGQDVPARHGALIDAPLDGDQQVGGPLHFVDDHRGRSVQEDLRIAPGQLAVHHVVEGAVRTLSELGPPHERRLSRLARTGQDRNGQDLERPRHRARREPGEEVPRVSGGRIASVVHIAHDVGELLPRQGRKTPSFRGNSARGRLS